MKLIRDKLGERLFDERIQQKSEGLVFQVDLTEENTVKYLKKKLVEEAKEVEEAENIVELAEELADVFEVMKTIGELKQISMLTIQKTADEKRKSRGGFRKGWFFDYV